MNYLAVRRVLLHFFTRGFPGIQTHCNLCQNSKAVNIEKFILRNWSSTSSKQILSVSTLLLQDGLDIQELPIIVRHSDKLMLLSNDDEVKNQVRHESVEDVQFKLELQTCVLVTDVFKLLDVPADQVNVYSATNALLKICQLQQNNKGLDNLHSFIHTAIMHELYGTLNKDIATLTHDKLTSIFLCSVRSEYLLERCSEHINQEIEKRIGDEQFSIDELCTLCEILQTYAKENTQLHEHLWIHIGNRYQDINETDLVRVYNLLPTSRKYLIKVLDKQFRRLFEKLQGADIVSILSSYLRLNYNNHRSFKQLANCLYLNIHDITETDLMFVVTAFIHLKYPVDMFFKLLEKYVTIKKEQIEINLLALIVELCRSKLYLSPIILDAAAGHFTQHGDLYNPLQLFIILRTFGQLNYLPKDSIPFLFKVESVVDQKFYEIGDDKLLEILCSFAMVAKISVNLVQRVLCTDFLKRIKGLPISRQQDAEFRLRLLQSSAKLDRDNMHIRPPLLHYDSIIPRSKDVLMKNVESSLIRIFGNGCVTSSHVAKYTIHNIDFELLLDEHGNLLQRNYVEQAKIKIAVIQLEWDDYCVNCPHLVGKAAMKERHLKKVGYNVISIPSGIYFPSRQSIDAYIITRLKEFI